MATSSVQVERRVGQRFPYHLAVSLRVPASSQEGVGFTQDLSSRGVFFFTDSAVSEGTEIELTLRMPSEITLGENMPVRCRGRVLRVSRPAADASDRGPAQTKIGVAVRLDGYEYLSEVNESATRAASLHAFHDEDDRPVEPASAR
jgi:hypothetical protein